MALLWIEGFEGIGTSIGSAPAPTGVMGRKYSVVTYENVMLIQTGRLGGYSLRFSNAGAVLQPATLTTDATMIVGTAVRFGNVTQNVAFLSFYDGTTQGMNVWMAGAGELSVRRGSTTLATTSGLGLQTNTWYYLEFKVLCHSTAGSYELRVNGVTRLSASSQNTKAGSNNYHTTFRLAEGSASLVGPWFDDLYCCDGSGSSNNDFLGNCRVYGLVPNGDVVGFKDFTPSSGSDHYLLVNENPANDDTSYVESATPNHTNLWTYGDISTEGLIMGAQINTMARETDAQNFSLKNVARSGTTISEGVARTIGSVNYTILPRVLERDPATNQPWSVEGLNAAQFGVRVG